VLRLLNYMLSSAIAITLIMFALANRDVVTISLLPDELSFIGLNFYFHLPIFVVFFGGAIFGIMIGFVMEWMREYKLRSALSFKNRELKGMQTQLQQLKSEKYENKDDVLALIEDTIKEPKKSAQLM
jgi:lipopolysaccharide assembly protein A